MRQITASLLKINEVYKIISWNSYAEVFVKNNFDKNLKNQLSITEVFPSEISTKFQNDFISSDAVFQNLYSFSEIENLEITCSPCLDVEGNVEAFSLCLKLTPTQKSLLPESIIQAKNIVENSSLAIFLSDPTGPVIEVNKAACRMFGYTFEEFKHLSREDIVLKNADLKSALEQRNLAGELRHELTGVKKNGETFPCEIHSVIYTNHNGEKRTSTAIIDISARKNQELITENIKQAFQSLFDYNPDAVYSFDLEGNFLSINDSAMKLAEGSREKALKTNFLSLIPSEDKAKVINHFTKAVSGEIQHYETGFISFKGSKKLLQVTNFPFILIKK